ncbi:hypothetical protein LLH00_14990 [bacterium]|nr:hypothetical protein [bacterium]
MSARPVLRKITWLMFAVWLGLSWAAIYCPLPRLWGMLPAGKPAGVVFLVWALFCLAVLLGLEGGLTGRALQRVFDRLARAGAPVRLACLAAFSGAVFLLGWAFRSRNHFMGDGWLYLNVIHRPFHLIPDRPLDYVLHHQVFWYLSGLGKPDGELAFNLLHCSLLPFFILALWSLAGRLTAEPVKRTALTLILAGSSALQLFCGYIETYTVLAFFSALFLAAGAAYAASGRYRTELPWEVSLIFGLAFLSHRSAVVLAPSLLFLWLLRLWPSGPEKTGLKQSLAVLALCPLPLLAMILLHSASLDLLVPLLHNDPEIVPYTIFSLSHLGEKLNFMLLAAPAALIALPALAAAWGEVRARLDFTFLFLSLAALGGVFFLFSLNPLLGVRDWDLLSLCAVPASAWAGWVLLRFFEGGGRLRGNPLLALGLAVAFHGALWVWINSDINRGVGFIQRVRRQDIHTATGKTNLAQELANRGFLREAIEQNKLAQGRMFLRGRVNLSVLFMRLGQPDSTIFYTREAAAYEKAHRLKPTPTVWIKAAAAFDVLEQPDSANYYYLFPLRRSTSYYEQEDRAWWLGQMNLPLERYTEKARLDKMNIDYILFFLRYNNMLGQQENVAKIYGYYQSAGLNEAQWLKLLDFAVASHHYEYLDSLTSHAFRQFPDLQRGFVKKP